MSVTINTRVIRALPVVNDNGLVLAILKNARQVDNLGATITEPTPVRLNSLEDLYANFEVDTQSTPVSLKSARELYVLEYLIRAGVNVLALAVKTPASGIQATDIAKVNDEQFNYKFVIAPYEFITNMEDSYDDESQPGRELLKLASDRDVQVFLDINPFVSPSIVPAELIATRNAKISIQVNTAIPNFISSYSIIPSTYDLAVEGAYSDATDFVGIPASAAVVARQARYWNAETPYLPVAGETYGVFNEFNSVLRALKTTEKNSFQAKQINPLVSKIGVGAYMTAQNTMHASTNPKDPLLRRHIVSLTLWIKRYLRNLGEAYLYLPNVQKTWTSWELRVAEFLENLQRQDAILKYQQAAGDDVTTPEEIAEGIMKAYVAFLPTRVTESIILDLLIQESEGSVDIFVNGGTL